MPDKPTPIQIYDQASIVIETLEGNKEVKFLYPVGIRWECIRCGSCCRDADKRERRILLTCKDIRRIQREVKYPSNFREKIDGEPFVGKMRKVDGSCVFLESDLCRIYDNRALLCRMYPFWIEWKGSLLVIRFDNHCNGIRVGTPLHVEFFRELMRIAVVERGGLPSIPK